MVGVSGKSCCRALGSETNPVLEHCAGSAVVRGSNPLFPTIFTKALKCRTLALGGLCRVPVYREQGLAFRG